MNRPTSQCYTAERLREFAHGELSDDAELTRIAEHLVGCADCRREFDALPELQLAAWLQASLPTVHGAGDTSGLQSAARNSAADSAAGDPAAGSPGEATSAAWIPGRTIGPYRLEARLGTGGMGTVYRATHTALGRTVAIKLLREKYTQDADIVARFQREMKAVGKVQHPHIVQAHDAGEIAGTHYLAMEYVAGINLAEHVRQQGPLPVAEACTAVRQAALALAAAHAAGLVHRDVKPSNLLLDRQSGQVKLLDLGLARLIDDVVPQPELTAAGDTFGTPDYMAPEQWDNSHTADARADLYALGCTLFFLLTGRPPYGDDGHQKPLHKMTGHVYEPIPDLQPLRPDVPEGVIAIYRKLLAKKPSDRMQSAQELAEALLPFAISDVEDYRFAAQTTISREPPRNRHRATWFAGGFGAVLLLGGVVIIVTQRDGTKSVHTFSGPVTQVEIQQDGQTATTVTPSTAAPAVAPPSVGHRWPAEAPPPAIAPFDTEQARSHQEAWAKHLGVPVEWENSLGMKFVLIPPGEFWMGSTEADERRVMEIDPTAEPDRWLSERPSRRKVLSEPYYLGKFELARGPFSDFVAETNYATIAELETGGSGWSTEAGTFREGADYNWRHTGFEQSDDHPVVNICGWDVIKFLNWLSLKDGLDYSLPTEVQWEFAVRAGSQTTWPHGNAPQGLHRLANLADRSAQQLWSKDQQLTFSPEDDGAVFTAHVGSFAANPFGVHDLIGNVSEVCLNMEALSVNRRRPAGSSHEPCFVLRGAAWSFPPRWARSTFRRTNSNMWFRSDIAGFRLCLPAESVRWSLQRPPDLPPVAVAPFDAKQARAHQEAWAKHLGVPVEWENSLGMKFVLIPPGEFEMGSTEVEIEEALADIRKWKQPGQEGYEAWAKSEAPRHRVILPKAFYLQRCELTQEQYADVTGKRSFYFSATGGGGEWVAGLETSRFPADMVSWNDAIAYCNRLSERESLSSAYLVEGNVVTRMSGRGYRLPTEAEWEFAARAGSTRKFWCGDREEDLRGYEWTAFTSGSRPQPVGELKPNPFRLFDMLGNQLDWVFDSWEPGYYGQFVTTPALDPQGPDSRLPEKIRRGGSWGNNGYAARPAFRSREWSPDAANSSTGLRLGLSVDGVRAGVLRETSAK